VRKLWVVLLWMPAWLWADSHAYVVASGENYKTPGAITPLNTTERTLGESFFVPIGGYILAIPPGSKEVWQVVSAPECICPPFAINVLDPASGATLATIPLATTASVLIFDPAGRFAYVELGNGDVLKIAVASRKVVLTASVGVGAFVFSSDGSKLFTTGESSGSAVVVLDPQSLQPVGEIPLPSPAGELFVTGNTLLIVDGLELLFFDTATLKQTNSVPISPDVFGYVFAVGPDRSRIYLSQIGWTGNFTIEAIDAASGQLLVSRTVPAVNTYPIFLSADGSQIIVASTPALFLDAKTLAITKRLVPVGTPNSAAYIDSETSFCFSAPPAP